MGISGDEDLRTGSELDASDLATFLSFSLGCLTASLSLMEQCSLPFQDANNDTGPPTETLHCGCTLKTT